MLASCKSMEGRNKLKDFNQPRALSNSSNFLNVVKESHKKVVIIYIANDTYSRTYGESDRNYRYIYDTLMNAAREHAEPNTAHNQNVRKYLEHLANRLRQEFVEFDRSTRVETEALKDAACRQPSLRRDNSTIGGIAVFTNSMSEGIWGARDPDRVHRSRLRYEFCRYKPSGNNRMEERFVDNVIYVPEFPTRKQPLTNPENVKQAIRAVQNEFEKNRRDNDDQYRYIVVVKSHGSDDKLIVPLVQRDLVGEKVTRETIVKSVLKPFVDQKTSQKRPGQVLNSEKLDTPILNNEKLDTPILSTAVPAITQINKLLLEEKSKAVSDRDSSTGFDKMEFLHFIATEPTTMYPIIIWYSCRSALEYALTVQKNDQFLEDIVRNSKGNELLEEKPGQYTGIKSYSNLGARNAGVLITSDLKGVRYDEIKFGLLNDRRSTYYMIPDLQDAILQLLKDTAKKKQ